MLAMCEEPASERTADFKTASLTSARERMAPRLARSFAVARPMPLAAPVIAI